MHKFNKMLLKYFPGYCAEKTHIRIPAINISNQDGLTISGADEDAFNLLPNSVLEFEYRDGKPSLSEKFRSIVWRTEIEKDWLENIVLDKYQFKNSINIILDRVAEKIKNNVNTYLNVKQIKAYLSFKIPGIPVLIRQIENDNYEIRLYLCLRECQIINTKEKN